MTYRETQETLNKNYWSYCQQFFSGDQSAYELMNVAKKSRDEFEDKMIRNKVDINAVIDPSRYPL